MKKAISLFTFLLFSTIIFAQETFDPKVTSKSSYDTYINKIILTDNYTVVSMKFVSKSLRDQIDEYIRNNPRLKRQLDQLDSYTRRLYMERLALQMQQGSNTISFQPSSYLKSKDGRKYKFIKASSIPVSPDNIVAEPDKRYYFKVYFERLDPGIELIDLIEGDNERGGGMTYWNFYGVEVNNPPTNRQDDPEVEEPEEIEKPERVPVTPTAVLINLSGKVLDAKTNQPISAKIVCIEKKTDVKYDSVITSRSGKFEFEISPDDYLYKVSAPGYQDSEESFDLSYLKSSKSFERNFYLEPIAKVVDETVEQETEDEIEPEEEPEETTTPVEIEKNTFRLDKVYFNLGEATILPESYEQLEGVVSMMRDDPNMRIQLIGHTDNQGDSKLNKKLSLRRAYNVREYLIDKGIDGNRIKFKGVGGSFPIAPNDTEENRQKNRRVEFVILEKS